MHDLRRLSPCFAVAGQIRPGDLPKIAALGFRSVINNRPDDEESAQPRSEDLAAAAFDAGLSYRDLPVSGPISDLQANAMSHLLETLPSPVLAFCRSGRRSASLWALVEAKNGDPDAILAATREAGYALDELRPRLETLARAR